MNVVMSEKQDLILRLRLPYVDMLRGCVPLQPLDEDEDKNGDAGDDDDNNNDVVVVVVGFGFVGEALMTRSCPLGTCV